MKQYLFLLVTIVLSPSWALAQPQNNRHTQISIHGEDFYINDQPTYMGRTWNGHRIEGLLLNARMVQGIFDDLNPETTNRWIYQDTGKWDAERNTREFITAMVEIAKATSFRSCVVIMDEPTSAITEHEVAMLFRLIRQLKARGTGIIYITHKLDELAEIADDITVFRDGRFIATKPFADTTRDEMVWLMVGRDLTDLFPKTSTAAGNEMLRVKNISLRHPERAGDFVVHDVSFSVRKGEVLGLFGLMGAGRTELLQTIFGLHPRAATGEIWIEGQPVCIRSPRAVIDAGLALAPEDRKGDGLVLMHSVAENTTPACLEKISPYGLLRPALERDLVSRYVERLRVRTPTLHQAVRHLSGGNLQKVVLAKWLATEPKILLLDEPTRGIDINAKKEIYGLVDELAHSGLAMVMVSSELPEIFAIADRILVLAEGRVTVEFARGAATEETILRVALPGGRN
jgi:ribose transport system ATP-binding protein